MASDRTRPAQARALWADPTGRNAVIMMAAFSLMQGVPGYFFSVGLPALLRDQGASLEMIGWTYVIWLPLALQWLWAPAFDAGSIPPFGRRMNWLRMLPVLLAAVFSLVAVFPPAGDSRPLLAVSLVCSAITATIRILLGSWIIHGTTAGQRAWANAAGVAAMIAGGIAGGTALLRIGQSWGWGWGIACVAVLIVALSLPAWLIEDRAGALADSPPAPPRQWAKVWATFLRRPGIGRMMLIALGFGAVSGADVLVPAMMVDRGFTPAETLWTLGTFSMAAVIPATALIGAAIRRNGVLTVLAVLYGLKVVVLSALALSQPLGANQVAALAVGDYFLTGVLTVATWQIFMNFARGQASATDFSLLTSIDAGLRALGGIAAGRLAGRWDYAPGFAVAAVAAGVVVLLALRYAPPLQEGD